MNIQFIGQGLSLENKTTVGSIINNSFKSDKYNIFSAFVAFVSTSGIKKIIENIQLFQKKNGKICLYIGVNLHATSKEALELLLEYKIETYIIYSPNNIIYHPKIYIFKGNKDNKVIIGSSNFTSSGLYKNMEASINVEFVNNDEDGENFLSDIYDHFNLIINKNKNCQLLTTSILDLLIKNKVVISEKIIHEKNNKDNNDYGQVDDKDKMELLKIFKPSKIKQLPKDYKKTVSKELFIIDKNSKERSIFTEDIELKYNSMWIETGKMTGGSRNILDLSKKGKRGNVIKSGSLSFFGLDPEQTSIEKDINIQLEEKIFIGNRIFYAEGNKNWRIRLNGESKDGEKITLYSKPTLGNNGAFQDKILMFTLIKDNTYKLEILNKFELEALKEYSDWANGGSGNGRSYGVIR